MRQGTLKKVDGTSGVSLGGMVFLYVQTPAFEAVVAAQKVRGATVTINCSTGTSKWAAQTIDGTGRDITRRWIADLQ